MKQNFIPLLVAELIFCLIIGLFGSSLAIIARWDIYFIMKVGIIMSDIEIRAAIFFGAYIFFIIEAFVLIGTVRMNLSFLNPIRNYNAWENINWFGIIVITLILNIICIPFAVGYWLYKLISIICTLIEFLFTVGRR